MLSPYVLRQQHQPVIVLGNRPPTRQVLLTETPSDLHFACQLMLSSNCSKTKEPQLKSNPVCIRFFSSGYMVHGCMKCVEELNRPALQTQKLPGQVPSMKNRVTFQLMLAK
jgi:hypothetical protein